MTVPEEGAFYLIDKPLEWTSFDVVNKLRYVLHTRKIGHAGTLDPLATGLLIVCAGKMTKRINEFQEQEKEYTGTFVIGQETASYDLETEPTAPTNIDHITREAILSTAKHFTGRIQQVPPIHSSIKVNGKRAYDLARKGHKPKLEPREIEIREFEITRINKQKVDFRVVCTKGTYIRSLAHDFGQHLGVGAYLAALRRTRIGDFRVENAVTLDSLAQQYVNA